MTWAKLSSNVHHYTRRAGSSKRRVERAATMIELAMTAAIFFSMLFGLMWFGRGIGARTNLVNSIGDGLRFGVTWGSMGIFYNGPMTELKAWYMGGAPSARVIEMLCYNSQGTGPCTVAQFNAAVNVLKGPAYAAHSYNNIPGSHWTALVAVHQYMRLREGQNLLSYPCTDRPGCLSCRLINPLSQDIDAITPDTAVPGTALTTNPAAWRNMGIDCSYRADYGLLGPALILLGAGDWNPLKIERRFYVNRYSEDS